MSDCLRTACPSSPGWRLQEDSSVLIPFFVPPGTPAHVAMRCQGRLSNLRDELLCHHNPSGGAWVLGAGGDVFSSPGRSCWWGVVGGCSAPSSPPVRDLSKAWSAARFLKCSLATKKDSELLFSSVLPARSSSVLFSFYLHTLFADLLILLGEKSLHSSPWQNGACFLFVKALLVQLGMLARMYGL